MSNPVYNAVQLVNKASDETLRDMLLMLATTSPSEVSRLYDEIERRVLRDFVSLIIEAYPDNKVEAIRVLRRETGLQLKPAKELIEKISWESKGPYNVRGNEYSYPSVDEIERTLSKEVMEKLPTLDIRDIK